jgi:biotin operon repressor
MSPKFPIEQLSLASRTTKSHTQHPHVERNYLVPMVVRAMEILSLLETERRALRLEEIHKKTGYARTSIYRLLRTLVACGYLFETGTGHYGKPVSRA